MDPLDNNFHCKNSNYYENNSNYVYTLLPFGAYYVQNLDIFSRIKFNTLLVWSSITKCIKEVLTVIYS